MKRPFDIVCALVRNRVFGTGEEIPAGVDWEAVLECAVRQEVNAICYEAVKLLPQDRQPSFALMMKWDVSAQAIREMYSLRLKAAREVCDILGAEGIRNVMNYVFSSFDGANDVCLLGLIKSSSGIYNAFMQINGNLNFLVCNEMKRYLLKAPNLENLFTK